MMRVPILLPFAGIAAMPPLPATAATNKGKGNMKAGKGQGQDKGKGAARKGKGKGHEGKGEGEAKGNARKGKPGKGKNRAMDLADVAAAVLADLADVYDLDLDGLDLGGVAVLDEDGRHVRWEDCVVPSHAANGRHVRSRSRSRTSSSHGECSA